MIVGWWYVQHATISYITGIYHYVFLYLVDFSSLAKIFGRMFDRSFSACTFFFFFEVEISSRTLISLFMPGSEEKKVFDVCVFCF